MMTVCGYQIWMNPNLACWSMACRDRDDEWNLDGIQDGMYWYCVGALARSAPTLGE